MAAGHNLDGKPQYVLHRVQPSSASVVCFRDDMAAWEYVGSQAGAGSDWHRHALDMVDPSERAYIVQFCGRW